MHSRTTMGRIAVTDGMAPAAVEVLQEEGHEVVQGFIESVELKGGALREYDAIIVRSATKISADIIKASISDNGLLRVIGRAGVGVDNIDTLAATEHGVQVVNAPLASTQSVVELTIAHILASLRHIPRADSGMKRGAWEKKELKGTELQGKALGFIGFGRIAQRVAVVAKAIGATIFAFDPYLPKHVATSEGATLLSDVDDLFRQCSHIAVHCNLTKETRHMVNAQRIAMMPGTSPEGIPCGNHIVSCARGGIVDEGAMFDALQSGQLSSAALDVFEVEPVDTSNPLLRHPNFHSTPHIGAATVEAQHRVGMDIVRAVMQALSGGEVETIVNPDVIPR